VERGDRANKQFFLKNLRKTGHSAKAGDIEDKLQGM
jgi:hypothetical protein